MMKGQTISISPADKKRFVTLVEAFKKARVLVIGDFILDQFMWGTVDRISPEAPVPVVLVKDTEERPGGAGNVGGVTAEGGVRQHREYNGLEGWVWIAIGLWGGNGV